MIEAVLFIEKENKNKARLLSFTVLKVVTWKLQKEKQQIFSES